jgi:hypothetical protein
VGRSSHRGLSALARAAYRLFGGTVTNSDARPTFDKFRTNPIAVPQLPSATERPRENARLPSHAREASRNGNARVFRSSIWRPGSHARKTDLATVISIDEGDAAIESLAWSASLLGWFRRRLTALRRTVLNFDGVEIFHARLSQTRQIGSRRSHAVRRRLSGCASRADFGLGR